MNEKENQRPKHKVRIEDDPDRPSLMPSLSDVIEWILIAFFIFGFYAIATGIWNWVADSEPRVNKVAREVEGVVENAEKELHEQNSYSHGVSGTPSGTPILPRENVESAKEVLEQRTSQVETFLSQLWHQIVPERKPERESQRVFGQH